MQWLTENWVWVLIAAAFIGMHFFGHGGHGGHGGGCGGGHGGGDSSDKKDSRKPAGHQH